MIHILKLRLKTLSACLLLLAGLEGSAAVVQVTENISGVTTWKNSNEYVLNGFIYVLGNGVLNIEQIGRAHV